MTSTPKTERYAHEGEIGGGGTEAGSGHRGSLRGANKLARRARSFKDDLLERISNMRSPAQAHHQHLVSGFRSHSPLSPKLRNMGSKTLGSDDGDMTPAKELEQLVKEVKFGLKHFCDVISKRKLEMLPGNGTIVFETIANIHKAIKPYCVRSPALASAVTRLCAALACLIRLCDEVTAASLAADAEGDGTITIPALQPAHVASVVEGVTQAVAEVARLAVQHMTRPALSPRPALVSPRASTQRNSLPDIPLTPKERSLLTGEGNNDGGGVRASHSSESVLDAPDPPPPKPPRPHRKMDLAPPLPPKRKPANENSLLALSIDRVSLQSHSSGSLDSVLNVSNDDEIRNIMDNSSNHDNSFNMPLVSDLVGICSCNNVGDGQISLDSSGQDTNINSTQISLTNHNRFSSESGFASMGQNSAVWSECSKLSIGLAEMSNEHNFSSSLSAHHYTANSSSNFDNVDGTAELKCAAQSFESRMNLMNNITSHQRIEKFANSVDTETPPALPAKTRRNIRADVQQHFPNVEIRQLAICSLHGETRPHTLADHHPPRPPPLPLKKKHIMAYMEMFGNCSHPPSNANATSDMFRHSIHTYNMASAQHTNAANLSVQRQQQIQRSIAQSYTVQHFSTPPLSGSEDAINTTTMSGTNSVSVEPPALPPKMSKSKQLQTSSTNELVPPLSPRLSSHNSTGDDSLLNNSNSGESYVSTPSPRKFPLEDELERLVQSTPSPVPSQRSEGSIEPAGESRSDQSSTGATDAGSESGANTDDIILHTDVSNFLLLKAPGKDGSDVRGGNPDALVVLATKASKDFVYQEAFLATYRTWLSPDGLIARLVRRAHHFRSRPHELRSTLSLLTRVIADLTTSDLDGTLMQEITEFVYWLVETEELPIAKAVRQILMDKQKQLHQLSLGNAVWEGYGYSAVGGTVCLRRDTLLDFKALELAEQMTLLDAALFTRITTAEVLSWPRDQSEESSPNLTRFTEHFNKMSYWARSRILEQDDAKERERYATKFLKVMKALRKINNFNSYLALVSALDSPPVRRLGWARAIIDAVHDHCAIIDSSSSFRAYRQALAETHPPCIPYIGLVLQDLTFVHIGNPDLLPDGSINFTKRWQQYHIILNMKRFHKEQYKYQKNERVIAMFNGFDDVLSEEAMWQISETIKPRGKTRAVAAPQPAPVAPQPAA